MRTNDQTVLRRALKANAVFSALSGLGLLVGTRWVSAQLGLQQAWIVPLTGIGLLGFALGLIYVVRQERIARSEAITISAADLAWVTASMLLLGWDPTHMTTAAQGLVLAVAGVVFGFACTQLWGLQKASCVG